MSRFSTRSHQKELMDDLQCQGPELRQTLRELKIINKFLGGNHVTTDGIQMLLESAPSRPYTIADIGCGGGDMIKVMAGWAKKNNFPCHFIGIDANPNIIRMASENLKDLENVSFQTANAFSLDFKDRDAVDIITCSLFIHHFTDEELIIMLQGFRQRARIGMVINDLHRHPISYHSIKMLTWLFSKSQMVRNDGPISVLRSFRRGDFKLILEKSGWVNYSISWKWAFRWQVLCT